MAPRKFLKEMVRGSRLRGSMISLMVDPKDDSYPTRSSLLERLKNTSDQQSWQEFNDVYRGLIFRFALKAGLTETEAEDVAQETLIAAAKNLPDFRYDPEACSFKTWLLNLTRWRITDQFRHRQATSAPKTTRAITDDTARTATVERVPDPTGVPLELLWDQEWEAALLHAACDKIKARVDLKQWQMFDLYVLKQWSVREVAGALGVSVGRVYLAKHRVSTLLKKEVTKLKARMI